MTEAASDKRARLVRAAADLLHRQGFENTSLADIAHAAGVPLGNMYYYFKTKAQIAEAVIAGQCAAADAMRERFERLASPKDRLLQFVEMTAGNRDVLARNGCPVGSLCSELQKEGGALAVASAQPFAALLDWLEAQFAALKKGPASRSLAVHLLAALQGISLLSNGFREPELVVMEADHLRKWIQAL